MRTSLYSILCIGIRLAAVLLAVNTLIAAPAAFESVSRGEWSGDAWWIGSLYAAQLALASILWVYPGLLARTAAGKASEQVFESPIGAAELQTIAFSIVGLWILFSGVFGLAYDAVREIMLVHAMRGMNGLQPALPDERLVAWVVSNLLRVGIGIALLMGSRGLVGVIRRFRHAGFPVTAETAVANEEQTS